MDTATLGVGDVERIKQQIDSILDSLLANKDIVELDSNNTPNTDTCTGSQYSGSQMKPNKLSTSGTKSCASKTGSFVANVADNINTSSISQSGLSFDIPTYMYLESQTFLVSLFDKWVWGTTICNTSKTAAIVPDLTLSLSEPNSMAVFCYNYVISLVDSNTGDAGIARPDLLGIPFHRETTDQPVQLVQPGCKAAITAIFETPVDSWSKFNRVNITATLNLSGKLQWVQHVKLDLASVSLSKDETYERFESQIFTGTTSCQEKFRVERLLSQPRINQSLSKTFTEFLLSLGFKEHFGESSFSVFICGLPTHLFGTVVKVERCSNDDFQCSFSSRSPAQMEALLALFSNWREQVKGRLRIVPLSHAQPSDAQKRQILLSEIEILTHLIALEGKGLLDSSTVVTNWIHAFAEVSSKTDRAFGFGVRRD